MLPRLFALTLLIATGLGAEPRWETQVAGENLYVAPRRTGLNTQQVSQTLERLAPKWQQCTRNKAAVNAARPELVVSFSIHPNGRVDEAVVQSLSSGQAQLEKCIQNTLQTARFPRSSAPTYIIRHPVRL